MLTMSHANSLKSLHTLRRHKSGLTLIGELLGSLETGPRVPKPAVYTLGMAVRHLAVWIDSREKVTAKG